ncbi:sulfatase [Frateuria sp. Soil773]|uniref:LTA synthase family protein n=1 Tax=Frateuria sp. Soil773 TaxID=1736407 RepID=UPI0006F42B2F|nr:LTA synthase family protein [Frateuria sp. Soil773]KRF02157.1 sulfatase [Frateuria sp. Soil773]
MQRIGFRVARRSVAPLCALVFFVLCVGASAWQEPEPLQKGFVLTLMLCVFGTLLFGLARVATALVVSGGLFALLKFMSVLKLRYLDSPLMASDFVYYLRSSLLETLRHYPHLLGLGIAVCVGVPLALWLAWRWDWRILRTRPPRLGLALRAGGAALCALAFWACLLPAGPFARVHTRNVWEKLSDDAQLTNFFVNLHDSGVQLPAQASEAQAERDWQATARGAATTRPPPYPDIVQVLEESTFDPSIFTDCSVPACRAAMFRPDERTRAHGLLRVHTFGGGTWVSEFAALTGMPQDIFGPGGMYAPYVLAPHVHDALALALQRLGYLTVAIYPTNGSFLNGRNAYHAYGFEQFYDAQQLGLEEWEESDAQMFAAAKRVYDKVKKPGQPVFVMILTLNQHGPHDIDPRNTLPPPFDRGVLRGLPARAALNFDTYLSRLRDSDRAMRMLEHDFLDRTQPTVLLHFGDHQPSFDGLIRDLPRTLPPGLGAYKHYLTYFVLKSNFAGAPLPSYPMLDIAYLPSMVLQAAGVPTDPYFSAETVLRTRCTGLYTDCANPALVQSYHAWTFGRLHVYE